MDIKLIIQSEVGVFLPVLVDDIQWITEKNGGAGQLEFQVVKEGQLSFKEGSLVMLYVDEEKVFKGYVFSKSRDKEGIISVVCYDQLRYFKNKNSYIYSYKQAGQVLEMLAKDFNLETGIIESTGYVIPSRIEDNSTLFDIMYTAVDMTNKATGKDYVLFDDFGKLCLIDSNKLVRDYFVNNKVCENFKYTSSIDKDTYNQVVLIHTDKRKGINQVYTEKADTAQWGVLQYYSHISEDVDGNSLAKEILAEHNRTGRYLRVACLGDITVRGGCKVMVLLDLGDFVQSCYMSVKKAKHYINAQEHIMELTLTGGEFVYE